MNGTILIMKYLEEYIVKNAKVLTEVNYRQEKLVISYKNVGELIYNFVSYL